MTINQATLILDEYSAMLRGDAAGNFPRNDVALARVAWALHTVYREAKRQSEAA
jgi:hypothetical protein